MISFFHTSCGIALAAVAVAGCSSSGAGGTDHKTKPAISPKTFHGEQARAVRAVDELDHALRDGDIERLCRPGAVFTPAVVAEMNIGDPCEQQIEGSSAVTRPPALSVAELAYRPGLAKLQVRVGEGPTVPLDVVRDRQRWLVSFSAGVDPLSALAAAR